ncbi:RNA-directed DNA polymerase, eukaryota [Tanacetum coccineum]
MKTINLEQTQVMSQLQLKSTISYKYSYALTRDQIQTYSITSKTIIKTTSKQDFKRNSTRDTSKSAINHQTIPLSLHLKMILENVNNNVGELVAGKDNLFSIKLHHGGKFTPSPKRRYVGGKLHYVDNIDMNLFNVDELHMFVKDLGYDPKQLMFYHYKLPDKSLDYGLRPLSCDADVVSLIKLVANCKEEIDEIDDDELLNAPVVRSSKTLRLCWINEADVGEASVDKNTNVHEEQQTISVNDYLMYDKYELDIDENLNLEDYTVYVHKNVDKNMNVNADDENVNADDENVNADDEYDSPKDEQDHVDDEEGRGNVREDFIVDEKHVVDEVEVNMEGFSFSVQEQGDDQTVTPNVDLTDEALEVLDFDSFDSDVGDDTEIIMRRKLRKLRKTGGQSCGIVNTLFVGMGTQTGNSVSHDKNKMKGKSVYLVDEDKRECPWKANSNTTVKIDVYRAHNPHDNVKRFKRIYVCLGALKDRFRASGRQLLGLDGAFMKGNYPESWTWFLSCLGEDLDMQENLNFTFIIDRQKVHTLVILEQITIFRQLLEARDSLVITALEYIREYLMKRIVIVQKVIEKSQGPLTPIETKIFNAIKEKASQFVVVWNGADLFQVNEVACIFNMTDNGMQVGLPEDWVHQSMRLIPPYILPQVGRPSKKRKKSAGEVTEMVKDGKLTRIGGTVTCCKCGQKGHNKRSCKGPSASASASQPARASASGSTSGPRSGSQPASQPVRVSASASASQPARAPSASASASQPARAPSASASASQPARASASGSTSGPRSGSQPARASASQPVRVSASASASAKQPQIPISQPANAPKTTRQTKTKNVAASAKKTPTRQRQRQKSAKKTPTTK